MIRIIPSSKLTQVTIPDKGSHYLKKSPSPTGAKPPPGEGTVLSPLGSDDGSPVKKIQQVDLKV